MKTAIFLKDGYTQVILTPETEWEKTALDAIEASNGDLSVKRGEFYACQGGYIRQSEHRADDLMLITATPRPTGG